MSRRSSGEHAWVEMSDADIQAMARSVQPDVDRILEAVAGQVASAAAASTAFRDGSQKTRHQALRRSIRVKKSRYELGGYIVQATAPHAHLVEFGHAMVTHDDRVVGHVPAHSFLRKAKRSVIARLGSVKLS